MVSRYSIRWRLPLSYAAIALVATLALGAVLLLTLRGYYQRVERDYLQSNAQAIAFSLGQSLKDDPPAEVLQAQLDSLAFLSSTRVWLYSPGEAFRRRLAAGRPHRGPAARQHHALHHRFHRGW
jgi:hypothetical protein